MHLLPMQCHACADAFLVTLSAVNDASSPCPACGGPGTIAGSSTYGWGDLVHFNELRQVVREARLSVAAVTDLRQRIIDASGEDQALREELRRAVGSVASVTLVRAVTSGGSVHLQRITAMLLTILGAIASACGRPSEPTQDS